MNIFKKKVWQFPAFYTINKKELSRIIIASACSSNGGESCPVKKGNRIGSA